MSQGLLVLGLVGSWRYLLADVVASNGYALRPAPGMVTDEVIGEDVVLVTFIVGVISGTIPVLTPVPVGWYV